MPKCINDPSRSYKGTEPSPKGLGYCAHSEKINSKKNGKDGNVWIVKKIKNGSKRWVKLNSKNVIIKVYLIPKITIIQKNDDKELYSDIYKKMPVKYKGIVTKYLEYFGEKFFKEALLFGINFQLQFKDIRKKFNISDKYDIKNFNISMKDYKLKNGKMIYEIVLDDKQKKYLNYFIYAIKEELDSGADGWGEGNLVFLDTEKAKKLNLGKIPNNIVIDVYPTFNTIK